MFFNADIEWLEPDLSDREGEWNALVTPHGNIILSGYNGEQEIIVMFTVTQEQVGVMIARCEVGRVFRSVATSASTNALGQRHIADTINTTLGNMLPAPVAKRPPLPKRGRR